MKLADLYDKKVVGPDGRTIGRVHEVRTQNGRIAFLDCGVASLIERFTSGRPGRAVRWEEVERITADSIVLGEAGRKPRKPPKKG